MFTVYDSRKYTHKSVWQHTCVRMTCAQGHSTLTHLGTHILHNLISITDIGEEVRFGGWGQVRCGETLEQECQSIDCPTDGFSDWGPQTSSSGEGRPIIPNIFGTIIFFLRRAPGDSWRAEKERIFGGCDFLAREYLACEFLAREFLALLACWRPISGVVHQRLPN